MTQAGGPSLSIHLHGHRREEGEEEEEGEGTDEEGEALVLRGLSQPSGRVVEVESEFPR